MSPVQITPSRPATEEEVAAHDHAWRQSSTFDGCHFFGSHYVCDCGMTKIVRCERARNTRYLLGAEDWMDGRCERCCALNAGAGVEPTKTTYWVWT